MPPLPSAAMKGGRKTLVRHRARLILFGVLPIVAVAALSVAPTIVSEPRAEAPGANKAFPLDEAPNAPLPILAVTPTPEPFVPPARSAPIIPPVRFQPTAVETVPAGPSDRIIYRVGVKQPVVFITIDDGWTRDPRVVALVRNTRLPVSLFLIQTPATRGEQYFQSLEGAGAKIEDHTKDHPDLTALSYSLQRAEICSPLSPFTSMFHRQPTLFRPPYGRWNQLTLRAAAACGVGAVVLWDAVMSGGKFATIGGLKPGDIILLHFRPTLYTDLVDLMNIIRAHRLGVGQLEDYLKFPPPTPKPSPSATFSPTPSPSPSHSPLPSPSPTVTADPTPSPSPKPTGSH